MHARKVMNVEEISRARTFLPLVFQASNGFRNRKWVGTYSEFESREDFGCHYLYGCENLFRLIWIYNFMGLKIRNIQVYVLLYAGILIEVTLDKVLIELEYCECVFVRLCWLRREKEYNYKVKVISRK